MSQPNEQGSYWLLVGAPALGVLLLGWVLPFSFTTGALIVLGGAFLIATGRLFSVEAYICLAAAYYWLGIANPFGADVHQAAFGASVMPTVTALVIIGLSLVYGGAVAGRRIAGRGAAAREAASRRQNPEVVVKRMYRAAYAFQLAGAFVALLSYAKLGIPALVSNSDVARMEFVGRLSPFTYYQWLLVEVGIGLAAMAGANDRRPEGSARRLCLALVSCLSVAIVAGVYSRVVIGTPLVTAAIVWWSQGRRISPIAAMIGVAVAVLVVSLVWITRIQSLGTFTIYSVDFDLNGGPMAAGRAIAAGLSIFARTSIEVFGLFVAGTLAKLHGEIAFMSLTSLLPGHHPGLGLFRISQMLGYNPESGTTVSIIGGMYADFGVLGVLLASPLLGLFLGYLEGRARGGDRLIGLFYAIALAYFLNMIYGGQLLDASLLWKLWLGLLAVRYCRDGVLARGQLAAAQVMATAALYGYGLLLLLTS